MFIKRLLIDDIRNLKTVSIEDFGQLNYFIGLNGSGKTSILEAISMVSQGRSFRSNKVQTVINQQAKSLRVFTECVDENEHQHKLGIERDRLNKYIVRVDGSSASTLAELATILPVLVLDTASFDLLDGSASTRRKFIDWGVFHVEHRFFYAWKGFCKILKQRNTLLSANETNYKIYEPWDIELVKLAIEIENYRLQFLLAFKKNLDETLSAFNIKLSDQTIFYKNGWGLDRLDFSDLDLNNVPTHEELKHTLAHGFARDLKFQSTHLGPHKVDIQFRSNKDDVKDIYSRGQKKIFVSALKLAQAKTVKMSSNNKSPVLLLDDLPSELDQENLVKFLNYVVVEKYQSFITAVDNQALNNNSHVKVRMFHVEHGKITQIDN